MRYTGAEDEDVLTSEMSSRLDDLVANVVVSLIGRDAFDKLLVDELSVPDRDPFRVVFLSRLLRPEPCKISSFLELKNRRCLEDIVPARGGRALP